MATGGSDQSSVQGQHEAFFDLLCSRCETRGDNTEATHYCPSCDKYFCDRCEILHGEFTNSTEHATLDRSRRGEWGVRRRGAALDTETCPHHSGQQLTMYCGQHEAICCLICDNLHHRTCDARGYLPDLARDISQSTEMASLMDAVSKVERDIRHWQEAKRRQRTNLWNSRARFLEEVGVYRARLVSLVENLERRATEQMGELYGSRDRDLLAKLNQSNELLQNMEDVREKLQEGSEDTNLFIGMKTGEEKVLECRQWLCDHSRMLDYEISFSFDETPHQHIERSNAIGTMDQNLALSSTPIQSLSQFQEVRIRQDTDTSSCVILGICQLLDGTLILADHHNGNLKKLDRQYIVVETFTMPGNPNGLCRIDKKEIAVALGSKKKVQIVTVTDKIRQKGALSFEHNCNSIAFNRGMLYITGNFIKTLYIYQLHRGDNVTYTRLRVIERFSPQCVAVSYCGSYVYHIGLDNKMVISDRNGVEIYTTVHPDLVKLDYKSVCVDDKGNVIVALKQNGIIQFKDAGTVANGRLLDSAHAGMVDYVFVDIFNSKLIFQRNSAFGGSETLMTCKIVYT